MKRKIYGIWVVDVSGWMCHQDGRVFWTEYECVAKAQHQCIDVSIRDNYIVRDMVW